MSENTETQEDTSKTKVQLVQKESLGALWRVDGKKPVLLFWLCQGWGQNRKGCLFPQQRLRIQTLISQI